MQLEHKKLTENYIKIQLEREKKKVTHENIKTYPNLL